MSITLVINTCAMQAQTVKSSAKQLHEQRAYILRNWILPSYIQNPYIDQLIVSGVWEEGEGYEYVHQPSVYYNCADAPLQRHVGFEKATGDVVIFQHDDHFIDIPRDLAGLRQQRMLPTDVLSPARYTRLRKVEGERLSAGEANDVCPNEDADRVAKLGWRFDHMAPGIPCSCKHPGYINGHCAIYRREVIEKCPWNVPPPVFSWDRAHTKLIQDAGFKITWTSSVCCWDVEMGSRPWL